MHFVVAGTGYAGRRVLAGLPAGRALGLNRSPLADPALDVRVLDLDRDDKDPLTLPTPYTLLYTIPPPPTGDDDPRLSALLERLAPPPVRIVYLSTSGVYGDRGGALTDETVPPSPTTPRARRRLAAEALLERWCERRGIECLILRVPGIYGPGRLGLERLRDGAAVLSEADAGPGNRIHVDDLVSCCLAAMHKTVPSGIYNLSDGNHESSTDFSRRVAHLAGLPPPPEITRAEAETQFSPMRLSFLSESRRLDTTKMREVLGVAPRYADLDDGIRASLSEDS